MATSSVCGDDVWRFGAPVGSSEPKVGSPVVARSGGGVMVRETRVFGVEDANTCPASSKTICVTAVDLIP
ncbi:hypothetical protein Bca4012_060718 [Brassica carinata]|uniref:Uncharacterized protein n=1 Tax=Brassica carinata TaxID=52824 RepID=A0A8X7SA02_BRACI|nr:hypothetical protein Bca52824_031062 [Brassica carinata]